MIWARVAHFVCTLGHAHGDMKGCGDRWVRGCLEWLMRSSDAHSAPRSITSAFSIAEDWAAQTLLWADEGY